MTKSVVEKSSKQNITSTNVSYELSLLITKKGSAHTVGEELIIPAAKIISNNLFDEKCTKKFIEIPLSNTTVKRRIDEMSENVKIAIITVLKQSEYFCCNWMKAQTLLAKLIYKRKRNRLVKVCRFDN